MSGMYWLILLIAGMVLLLVLGAGLRRRGRGRARARSALPPIPEEALARAMAQELPGPTPDDRDYVYDPELPYETAGFQVIQADDDAASVLLQEVFVARLRALDATHRFRLEALEGQADKEGERELLHRQIAILDERSAQLQRSYLEEVACYREVARFLARLDQDGLSPHAARIRQTLLHSAAPREAEAFLDAFSQEAGSRPAPAAQAAFLSGFLAERRVALPLAMQRYLRAQHILPGNAEYLRRAAQMAHLLADYETAIHCREARVQIIEKRPRHSETDLALAQRDLAHSYLKAGRFDLAGPLYKSAMAALSRLLGDTHPEMAMGWLQLGEMQEQQGGYDRAYALFGRALGILTAGLDRLDPQLAPVLEKLGALALDMGLEQEALDHYRQLVEIREKTLPAEHPQLAADLARLAEAYRLRGAYALAEECCLRSLRINEALHGREHAAVAASLQDLGRLCCQQGKLEAGERHRLEAEAILQRLAPRPEDKAHPPAEQAPAA